jgi:Tfp pilus assembly protein PilO
MMLIQLLAFDPDVTKTIGVVVVMLGAFAAAVLYPVARAYARRLEGKTGEPELKEQLADVTARLEALQHEQARIGELEERLDFTERLLARQHEAARLPERSDR